MYVWPVNVWHVEERCIKDSLILPVSFMSSIAIFDNIHLLAVFPFHTIQLYVYAINYHLNTMYTIFSLYQ